MKTCNGKERGEKKQKKKRARGGVEEVHMIVSESTSYSSDTADR
jgi:hypothetical protein